MEGNREPSLIRVPSEGGNPKEGETPVGSCIWDLVLRSPECPTPSVLRRSLHPAPTPRPGGKSPSWSVHTSQLIRGRPCLPPFAHLQSAEDKELSERLDLAVERLRDTNPDVQRLALELLRSEVRGATRWVAVLSHRGGRATTSTAPCLQFHDVRAQAA